MNHAGITSAGLYIGQSPPSVINVQMKSAACCLKGAQREAEVGKRPKNGPSIYYGCDTTINQGENKVTARLSAHILTAALFRNMVCFITFISNPS